MHCTTHPMPINWFADSFSFWAVSRRSVRQRTTGGHLAMMVCSAPKSQGRYRWQPAQGGRRGCTLSFLIGVAGLLNHVQFGTVVGLSCQGRPVVTAFPRREQMILPLSNWKAVLDLPDVAFRHL